MKENLKFGFDIDGCVFDIINPLLERLNCKLNKHFQINQFKEHNTAKTLKLPKEEIPILRGIFHHLLSSTNLKPYSGAINFITSYYEKVGYEPIFITKRQYQYEENTYNLIKKHLLIPFELHHTIEESKFLLIDFFGITTFIEDRRREAINLANEGIKVFLMDRPWNQMKKHKNITRIYSWYDDKLKI